jgi:hypothetical protein
MSRLKLLSFVVVLAVTASPLAAQTGGSSGEGSNSSQGGTSSQSGNSSQTGQSSQSSTTGVICEEEMTGTFCNTVTGSSSGGYGASSSSVGSTTPTPIPACGTFAPADELCN